MHEVSTIEGDAGHVVPVQLGADIFLISWVGTHVTLFMDG